MSTAPIVTMREDLPRLPEKMRHLPIDPQRRVPVPWFVAWVDGVPEFRAADARKFQEAIRDKRCWVCGEKLGTFLAFVLGPMCCITRTTSEPPCHYVCAEWSARVCPFLTKPRMVRREGNLPEEVVAPAGIPLDRNPGVAALWITHTFSIFTDHDGRPLLKVGDPEEVSFWSEGRIATLNEIRASVNGGLPTLCDLAKQDGKEAMRQLDRHIETFERLLNRWAVA